MGAQKITSLEKARACFYSWKFLDAYNLLRRYFDRLPFKPEEGHAEYIGMFARVLFELGKEWELKFYLGELEKVTEKRREPYLQYCLGVVYSYSEYKRSLAKTVFEDILRDPSAKFLHARAKMMLADYYLEQGDVLACRMLIDSAEVPENSENALLLEIWKAVVERREGKLEQCEARLAVLLKRIVAEENWYAYFSARTVQALLLLDQERCEEAKVVIADVRGMFKGRQFKSVQVQLLVLDERLEKKSGAGVARLEKGEGGSHFSYASKTVLLKSKSPGEKLLLLLIKRKFLDKPTIVKGLYDRQYRAAQDDKLIYYHVHALRKRLRAVGIPGEAIASEDNGYRLLPEVETLEEEI